MPTREEARLEYLYRFRLKDGIVREFRLALDPSTLTVKPVERAELPEWTRLSYSQCGNCPLKESAHPRCPVAVNLIDLAEAFKDRLSYEVVEVEIENGARRISKVVPLAEGIRSLFGLIMAASGCPVLDRLKPLVRTHLPFATWDETAFRVIGAYLIVQYFIGRRGGSPDFELKNLTAFYEEVKRVNTDFCQRLRGICLQDAPINAVAELDSLADMTSLLIKKGKISALEPTLAAFFGEKAG